MNFFEEQEQAKRSTRWLVVVYCIATLAIVAGVTLLTAAALSVGGGQYGPTTIEDYWPNLALAAALTLAFILGTSLYKIARLSAGGGWVALEMGGTMVTPGEQDPLRKRLRNIVEEMSIASGVPVPEIYVLEAEESINAFAAGFAPSDAAVAVTRGALEKLDRDELQGVIAHEFSHILNGDMRLNVRLMGVLFGILALGLIGRLIMRGGFHVTSSSRRGNSAGVAAAIVMLGLGLTILGSIGVFFARLIKAAVSRQREFLADASAVQFTRQPTGLANALKKIGNFGSRSYMRAGKTEEISHMLFSKGLRSSMSLFATHPPLTDRIKALDPSFNEEEFKQRPVSVQPTTVATENPAVQSLADNQLPQQSIIDRVGNPTAEHVVYAMALRKSLPKTLYDAAHSTELSVFLAFAIILNSDGQHREQQLSFLQDKLGMHRAKMIRDFNDQLMQIGTRYRLPLLEVALPAIRHRPPSALSFLLKIAQQLIEADNRIDLHEFCVYRILQSQLQQFSDMPRSPKPASRIEQRDAAIDLIAAVSAHGTESADGRREAFLAGMQKLALPSDGTKYAVEHPESLTKLEANLDALVDLGSEEKQKLLHALSVAILRDDRVSIAEQELMRAICATLDCPLPPYIGQLGEDE